MPQTRGRSTAQGPGRTRGQRQTSIFRYAEPQIGSDDDQARGNVMNRATGFLEADHQTADVLYETMTEERQGNAEIIGQRLQVLDTELRQVDDSIAASEDVIKSTEVSHRAHISNAPQFTRLKDRLMELRNIVTGHGMAELIDRAQKPAYDSLDIIRKVQAEKRTVEGLLQDSRDSIDRLRSENDGLSHEVDQRRYLAFQAASNAVQALGLQSRQIRDLRSEVNHANTEIGNLTHERDELVAERDNMADEVDHLTADRGNLVAEKNQAVERRHTMHTANLLKDVQIQELRASYQQLQTLQQATQNRANTLQSEITGQANQTLEFSESARNFREQLIIAEGRVNSLRAEATRRQADFTRLAASARDSRERMIAAEGQVITLQAEATVRQTEFAHLAASERNSRERMIAAEGQVATLQAEATSRQAEFTRLATSARESRERMIAAEGQVATLQAEAASQQAEFTRLAASARESRERMITAEGQLPNLQAQVETSQTWIEVLEESVQTSQEQVTTAQGQAVTLETELTNRDTRIQVLEASVQTSQEQATMAQGQVHAMETELTNRDARIQELEAMTQNAQERMSAVEFQAVNLQNKLNRQRARLRFGTLVQSQLSRLRRVHHTMKARFRNTLDSNLKLEEEHDALLDDIDQLRDEHNRTVRDIRLDHQEDIYDLTFEHGELVDGLQAGHGEDVEEILSRHRQELEQLTSAHREEVERIKRVRDQDRENYESLRDQADDDHVQEVQRLHNQRAQDHDQHLMEADRFIQDREHCDSIIDHLTENLSESRDDATLLRENLTTLGDAAGQMEIVADSSGEESNQLRDNNDLLQTQISDRNRENEVLIDDKRNLQETLRQRGIQISVMSHTENQNRATIEYLTTEADHLHVGFRRFVGSIMEFLSLPVYSQESLDSLLRRAYPGLLDFVVLRKNLTREVSGLRQQVQNLEQSRIALFRDLMRRFVILNWRADTRGRLVIRLNRELLTARPMLQSQSEKVQRLEHDLRNEVTARRNLAEAFRRFEDQQLDLYLEEEAKIAALKTQERDLRNQLEAQNEQLATQNEQLAAQHERILQLINQGYQGLLHHREERESLESAITRLNIELSRKDSSVQKAKQESEGLESEIDDLHDQLRAKDERHQNLLEDIKDMRADHEQDTNEYHELVSKLESDVTELQQRLDQSAGTPHPVMLQDFVDEPLSSSQAKPPLGFDPIEPGTDNEDDTLLEVAQDVQDHAQQDVVPQDEPPREEIPSPPSRKRERLVDETDLTPSKRQRIEVSHSSGPSQENSFFTQLLQNDETMLTSFDFEEEQPSSSGSRGPDAALPEYPGNEDQDGPPTPPPTGPPLVPTPAHEYDILVSGSSESATVGERLPYSSLPASVQIAVNALFDKLDAEKTPRTHEIRWLTGFSRIPRCARSYAFDLKPRQSWPDGPISSSCKKCTAARLPCFRKADFTAKPVLLPLEPTLREGLTFSDHGYWIATG